MSKLPAKQIYLLSIIVFGIITLSVYSTYAIFTFESETSDIVNLHTPNTLAVSTDIYEYKRVNVKQNDVATTDVDIYNTFNYELCYSVWYKIANKNIDSNNIKIYQITDNDITTNGTLGKLESRRIKLMIINDNNQDAIINIGVSSSQNNGTCELNISSDKSIVNSKIDDYKTLSDEIINNNNSVNHNSGYTTYKNINKEKNISIEKIFVSATFDYKDEMFTLNNPKEIEVSEISNYIGNYTCIESNQCKALYKINKVAEESDNNKNKISNYDILVGYQQGTSGIRNINNNYYYYGDNPNNYIYYNCSNTLETSTCELWRIIGVYQVDNKYITKIIKNDPIEVLKYSENNTNLWDDSNINKYLTENYKIKNNGLVESYILNQENILSLDTKIKEIKTIDSNKVITSRIMTLSDYLNASSCQKDKISDYDTKCLNDNWLNISFDNVNEWTMSIKYEQETVDELTGQKIIPENNKVYSVGSTIDETTANESLKVRPVIYLKDRVFLNSGNGTIDNPYTIK